MIFADLFRQQKLHDLLLIIYSADYRAKNLLSIVDSAFRSMEWRISGLVYHPPFTLFAFLNRNKPVILVLYTTRGTDEVTVSGDYNPPRLVQVPSKGNMWYIYISLSP